MWLYIVNKAAINLKQVSPRLGSLKQVAFFYAIFQDRLNVFYRNDSIILLQITNMSELFYTSLGFEQRPILSGWVAAARCFCCVLRERVEGVGGVTGGQGAEKCQGLFQLERFGGGNSVHYISQSCSKEAKSTQ
jgi:hypothetical protein